MTCKISSYVGGIEAEYLPPKLYAPRTLPSGSARLVAAALEADVLLRLVECLAEPFRLLYVLHTPRGEAEPGRYESPEMSGEELRQFLTRFNGYLKADARFDIWVHSPESRATIVWDRHNQIFAYGPLGDFEAALSVLGFAEGDPEVSFPHIHHYRSECDDDARTLLAALPWRHTPLRPEDEQ